jgi:hypothetical protein
LNTITELSMDFLFYFFKPVMKDELVLYRLDQVAEQVEIGIFKRKNRLLDHAKINLPAVSQPSRTNFFSG